MSPNVTTTKERVDGRGVLESHSQTRGMVRQKSKAERHQKLSEEIKRVSSFYLGNLGNNYEMMKVSLFG